MPQQITIKVIVISINLEKKRDKKSLRGEQKPEMNFKYSRWRVISYPHNRASKFPTKSITPENPMGMEKIPVNKDFDLQLLWIFKVVVESIMPYNPERTPGTGEKIEAAEGIIIDLTP